MQKQCRDSSSSLNSVQLFIANLEDPKNVLDSNCEKRYVSFSLKIVKEQSSSR